MNPFELHGPEFLLFYFCFSLAVIGAIILLRLRAESGGSPRIDLGDPYLIAYLRGGEDEALRVAVVSLVDRGMLVADGRLIRRADHVTVDMASRPIERAVLELFITADNGASVLKDKNLKPVFQPYQDTLERAGLLPDGATRVARLKRLLVGVAALGIVSMVKIQIGLSLERPVGFLVVMMIVAIVAGAALSFPRLTTRGKATLEDITNLYSGLRTQINSFSPGGASAELAMYAAVFGVAALAATPFAYAEDLFRRKYSEIFASSSCGTSIFSSCGSSDGGSSSCGSSDGGSSSDGGGGCGGGGCGGCGSS
ncbi:MAG TPA: TIGR04222 domain-containing membrane protein [Blastocatellia bacterium]|nr:TIGR04222 domain-containing membrane protein [Blastocatellia bacterium]